MKLREFVQKGGILVSSYRSFVCDRRIRVYDQVLPAFLEDVFGMHYDEHTNPVNTFGKNIVKVIAQKNEGAMEGGWNLV